MGTPSTQSPSRYDFIDRLRGIGILVVILYHAVLVIASVPVQWHVTYWNPHALPLSQGLLQLGLQWSQLPTLFFVISGFLAHRSHLRHPDRGTARTLLNRFLRLYVPYLIALALFALVMPSTRVDITGDDGLMQLLTHLMLTFTFQDETLWSINASFWYIATELHLCLLYPVLLLFTRLLGWSTVIIGLTALAVVMRVLSLMYGLDGGLEASGLDLGENWLANSAPAYAVNWMLGAWIAERIARGQGRVVGRWEIAAWAALGLLTTLVRPLTVFSALVMAFAMAAIFERTVMLNHRSRPAPRRFGLGYVDRALRYLGSISLAIYLFNQPLVRSLGWRLKDAMSTELDAILATALIATVTMAVAGGLFTRYVERPLGSWLEARIAERLRRNASVATR